MKKWNKIIKQSDLEKLPKNIHSARYSKFVLVSSVTKPSLNEVYLMYYDFEDGRFHFPSYSIEWKDLSLLPISEINRWMSLPVNPRFYEGVMMKICDKKQESQKVKCYYLSDTINKARIIGAIATSEGIKKGEKTCTCTFSFNKDDRKAVAEAIDALDFNPKQCIIMCGRKIKEPDTYVLQSAWVTVGKEMYDELFGLPKDVKNLDIQFKCVAEEMV